jgi:hypothetical protein
MYPFRHFDLPAGVPPGLVDHQKYALLLARSHLFGELIERHGEQLHIDRGQDQSQYTSPLSAARNRRGVGPLLAPLEESNGPLSLPEPKNPSHHRLRAQASLVLGPKSSTSSASGWASLSFSSLTERLF